MANFRWIAYTYPHLRIPISATGGATRWEDVIRCLLAGARTVQITSLIYMKGYDVVRSMLASIEEYLDRKGVEPIGGLIGRAAGKLQPWRRWTAPPGTTSRSRMPARRAEDAETSACTTSSTSRTADP